MPVCTFRLGEPVVGRVANQDVQEPVGQHPRQVGNCGPEKLLADQRSEHPLHIGQRGAGDSRDPFGVEHRADHCGSAYHCALVLVQPVDTRGQQSRHRGWHRPSDLGGRPAGPGCDAVAEQSVALVNEHRHQLLNKQRVPPCGLNDAALHHLRQVVLVHETDGGGLIQR